MQGNYVQASNSKNATAAGGLNWNRSMIRLLLYCILDLPWFGSFIDTVSILRCSTAWKHAHEVEVCYIEGLFRNEG